MDTDEVKTREAEYWSERFNILNESNVELTRQTYSDVERAFELAQRDIQRDIDAWMNRFADNNGVTLAEAKRLLNSGELKEFKWDVNEYIKRGRENAINGKWAKELENASARLHISRLEALKLRTQNHLETAFAAENRAVEDLVKKAYRTDYYHTCFEFQKGFGVGFDIAGIDERKLDMLTKKPWTADSRTFSDRIWERKDTMVASLHQEIIRNCIYGRSRNDMTEALMQYVGKDIKNAKYCAARVIRTETAFFTSQSGLRALLELGCEMYEVYLPIGAQSCEICREMNGKHFKLSEYVVGSTAPPFHPNCENGNIIPYYEDDFYAKGEPLPEDITFSDWEKKFVDRGVSKPAYTEVQAEYQKKAKPKQGTITYDDGYNTENHKDEVLFANWLHNEFGGDIKLLNERPKDKVKMPDYIWNGKLWDLKTASTEKSANGLIRKGLKQIESNPGGIFLNYGNRKISIDALLGVIQERMQWYKGESLDIMIIQNGKVVKVLRYEKRQ